MPRRIIYTDPSCNQYEVASCGSCGTPAPAPCNECPSCPRQEPCYDTCVEPSCGVSQLGQGLQTQYVVGLGNEDRVIADGQLSGNGANLIPWYWLDPSIVDPTADFTPRIIEQRCDGKKLVATDRNNLQLQNPNGQIIKTWTNPFSTLNTLTGLTFRLTDTNPYLNQAVFVPAGNEIQVRAGVGIDLEPIAGGGFKIINTSVIEPTAIQRVSNSGITLTGTGTGQNPYVIGIDCGTLRGHCGFVTSVNGQVPDENGNLIVAGGSTGISSILPDPANILSFTPAGSGILQAGLNCANLKANCSLLDVNSMIPLTRIAQSGATTGQVPVWNGTNWVATTPSAGTSVQYQEEGTNTGTANPTVINFTGTGVTASQTGGVVTVNVGGGASVNNTIPRISFKLDLASTLPAGSTGIPATASSANSLYDVSVFNNGSGTFSLSGNDLTLQPGTYLMQSSVKFDVYTDSGTVNTVYVFNVSASFNMVYLTASPFTKQRLPITGGGVGSNEVYSPTSFYSYIFTVPDISGTGTYNLLNAATASISRSASFSTTTATSLDVEQYISISKLA